MSSSDARAPSPVIAAEASPRAPTGLGVLAFAAAVIALDAAGIGHTIPGLSTATGADARKAAWFVTAYVLGALFGAPVFARLSSAWHRGRALACALVVFAAGALVVASANDFATVVAGRGLEGVGGSAILPLAGAHIAERWPATSRGKALSLLTIAYGIGFLSGIALTSVVLVWSYRFAFVLWAALASIAAFAVWRSVPAGAKNLDRRFDGGGVVLWIGVLATLAIALNRLSLPRGAAAVPFAAFVLLATVFAIGQARTATPLFPTALLRDARARIALALALLGGEGQVCVVQLPSVAVAGLGVSPAMSGPALAPLVVGGLAASAWLTFTLDRIGPPRALRIGAATLVVGTALLAFAPIATVSFGGAVLLIGFGVGVVSGAPLRALAAEVASASDRDAAQASVGVFTNVGLLLGGSLFGACAAAASGALDGLRFAVSVAAVLMLPLGMTALLLRRRAPEA